MARAEDEILRFVGSSFRSVWALELLLLLKRERRIWPRAELVTALRASELVVSHALDGLVAAGLAWADEGGASYAPVDERLAQCVEQAEDLYRSRPNAVRRAIITASARDASAFANAFRLRKD